MNVRLLTLLGGAFAGGMAYLGLRETEGSLRKKVVKAALSQVGNNDPNLYWPEVSGSVQSTSLSWCGAFALWCLHQAGLARYKQWVFGKGFLLVPPTPLNPTNNPKPGDIAYFHQSQHQAVVAAVYPDRTMRLVNGNGTGRIVMVNVRSISDAAAVYSIQPFIDEKLQKKSV